MSSFQQNLVKQHINKKAGKNKNKQKQNQIAQVKRWFSTRLEFCDRFRRFRIKIIGAASSVPKRFSFSITPITLLLQVKTVAPRDVKNKYNLYYINLKLVVVKNSY